MSLLLLYVYAEPKARGGAGGLAPRVVLPRRPDDNDVLLIWEANQETFESLEDNEE